MVILPPRIALLFASPLTHSEDGDGKVTPVEIEPLNLEAEQKLLHDVFTSAKRRIRVSVGVATRDTLLAQIATGNTRIIHYAGHGVRDGLGFEDGQGIQTNHVFIFWLFASNMQRNLVDVLMLSRTAYAAEWFSNALAG
jgi:hypothetical protein